MAKSTKKPSRKIAKKVAKKAPTKVVKKAPAKVAKKAPANAVKKVATKAAQNPAKKIAKKPVQQSVKKPVRTVAKKSLPEPVTGTGKRFLVIYHAPMEAMEQIASGSPEQQAAGMALWEAWAERVGSKLSDLGAPLINGIRLTVAGDSNPSAREVAGYSMLEAGDLEEVLELLEGHPHLSGWHPEATIEIHETMLMPEM